MANNKSCIKVVLDEYENAPNGSILIKQNGKWKPITTKELLKDCNDRLDKHDKLSNELTPLMNANKVLTGVKDKNDKSIARLQKLIAYLLYERLVDNGTIKEATNENELVAKIMLNVDDHDMPSEYYDYLKDIQAELVIRNNKQGGKE